MSEVIYIQHIQLPLVGFKVLQKISIVRISAVNICYLWMKKRALNRPVDIRTSQWLQKKHKKQPLFKQILNKHVLYKSLAQNKPGKYIFYAFIVFFTNYH